MAAPLHPSVPDQGPSPAPGEKPAKRNRLATPIALLALLLAVIAAGLSTVAVKKANDAASAADELSRRPAPALVTEAARTESTPTEPAASDPAAPESTAPQPGPETSESAEPTLDPKAEYPVDYDQVDLKVQATTRSRYIDLDAPQVDDQNAYDIILSGASRSAVTVRFADGVRVAGEQTPATQPHGCRKDQTFAALDASSAYNFRKGDTFCLLTSVEQARERAENQTVALVTINELGDDGLVVLKVRAWRLPS